MLFNKKLNSFKYFWLIIFIPALFFSIIYPLEVFIYGGFSVVVILDILIFLSFYMLFSKNNSFDELLDFEIDENGNKKINVHFIVIIISFLGFVIGLFVIDSHFSGKRIDILKQNGTRTKAFINSGFGKFKTMQSGNIENKLSLSFIDIKGKNITIENEVREEVLESVFQGDSVDIIYLPNYPNELTVLIGNQNLKDFNGIVVRKLTLEDIEVVNQLSDQNIQMTLYKISGLWKKQIDENGITFYYNFTTKEIIAKSFQNKLLYISDESFGIHFFEKENSLNPTIFFEKNPILRKIEIDFGSDSLITQKYIIKSGHFEGKNPFPRSNYGIGIVPMPSTIYFETRLKY